MRADEDRVAICFKFDRALRDALVAEAKLAERSLTREMIFRLRRSIELEQQQEATQS